MTVTGETPLLQTDRTDTGRIIESKQVAAMPLAFNRNFQGMMVTVPGATRPFRPHSQFFNSQDSLSSEVNGQSRLANNVQIEGLDNNHRTGLLTVLIPPAERSRPVSVTTSNYDAEFGRAGGAVTNVTLKSGTNTFKGSVFFFGNTEETNAQPASVVFTPTRTKPPTKYNQAGSRSAARSCRTSCSSSATTSGPIDILGCIYRVRRADEAIRNGDFSGGADEGLRSADRRRDGNGRTPFANNQIPADRISPIAQNILSQDPAAEHRRARRSARTTTRSTATARRPPTASTPSSTTR